MPATSSITHLRICSIFNLSVDSLMSTQTLRLSCLNNFWSSGGSTIWSVSRTSPSNDSISFSLLGILHTNVSAGVFCLRAGLQKKFNCQSLNKVRQAAINWSALACMIRSLEINYLLILEYIFEYYEICLINLDFFKRNPNKKYWNHNFSVSNCCRSAKWMWCWTESIRVEASSI